MSDEFDYEEVEEDYSEFNDDEDDSSCECTIFVTFYDHSYTTTFYVLIIYSSWNIA